MASGKIPLLHSHSPLSARGSNYSHILAPRSRMRMRTTAAKPALLQIGVAVPMLREELEGSFDYFTLVDQEDEASFLAKKGPLIRGVVTCEHGPNCDPTIVEEALVSKLPNLEIVSSFDHKDVNKAVDIPLCKRLGVEVTDSTRDARTYVCAATAQRLLMAISREIRCMGRYRRASRWPSNGKHSIPYLLCNKHVGIVGLDPIEAAIARNLENLNCTIGYCSRSQNPLYPNYVYFDSVVDLARHSDVLIIGCASTEQTTKIINREVLDALGPQGFLVNMSSDPVIDEKALADALRDGRIAGVGLNMLEKENGSHVPDELVNFDNCVLQFHADPDRERQQAMVCSVVANLEAHFAGKPLLSPVW